MPQQKVNLMTLTLTSDVIFYGTLSVKDSYSQPQITGTLCFLVPFFPLFFKYTYNCKTKLPLEHIPHALHIPLKVGYLTSFYL